MKVIEKIEGVKGDAIRVALWSDAQGTIGGAIDTDNEHGILLDCSCCKAYTTM